MPPLAGCTTGSPHAIASTTSVGHGSFTFVCRSTCARRKIGRRVALVVAAEQVHAALEAELVDERLDRAHEPPGDEQLRVRVARQQRRERPERELEPVLLRLVAAEQEHRAPARRRTPPA